VRLWVSAPMTIIQHVLSIEVSFEWTPADSSELGRLPCSYQVTPAIPDGGERHHGRRSGTTPTVAPMSSEARKLRGCSQVVIGSVTLYPERLRTPRTLDRGIAALAPTANTS
jgi:hypothetical protein